MPVVAVNLWYNVGSRNERPGRTGFAHLFEHMMFQGSQNVPDTQHIAHIERVGGAVNDPPGWIAPIIMKHCPRTSSSLPSGWSRTGWVSCSRP